MEKNNNDHENVKNLLQQASKKLKSDGLDIEFSQELADQDDLEAQQRSKAADERAKNEE